MEVQVLHALAAVGANVGHNAVAAFVHAKLLAQVGMVA